MATPKPVLYRISAPVSDFSGDVGGCHFAKGVYEGEVGEGPLAYFTAQGYTVEEAEEAKAPRARGGVVADEAAIQARIDEGIATGIEAYKAEQVRAAYDARTNDDLKAELATRELAVSGNHAELVARLIEADQAESTDGDNNG